MGDLRPALREAEIGVHRDATIDWPDDCWLKIAIAPTARSAGRFEIILLENMAAQQASSVVLRGGQPDQITEITKPCVFPPAHDRDDSGLRTIE